MVCEARMVEGLSDGEIVRMFQAARDREYSEILEETKRLGSLLRPGQIAEGELGGRRTEFSNQIARLKRRLGQAAAIDFFRTDASQKAEREIAAVEARLFVARSPEAEPASALTHCRLRDYHRRTWVTRKAIHVDRMASAWLIRRFIDRAARFRFVPPKGYRPKAGELRFDMFEAEFTHQGNLCTFEVLCKRFELSDPALATIAEIVHDIDLKESRYGHEETAGITRLIAGIAMNHAADKDRLERGAAVFDDLYECFRRQAESSNFSPRKSKTPRKSLQPRH